MENEHAHTHRAHSASLRINNVFVTLDAVPFRERRSEARRAFNSTTARPRYQAQKGFRDKSFKAEADAQLIRWGEPRTPVLHALVETLRIDDSTSKYDLKSRPPDMTVLLPLQDI